MTRVTGSPGFSVGSLVTPSGVYLGDPTPGDPDWIGLRMAGITGTDVVAIVGESRRDNARTVWHHKRGDVLERLDDDPDDPDNEPARWGNLLEPLVAHEWARRRKAYLAPGGIFGNHDVPWMRSQLDRLLLVCPDVPAQDEIVCALEVKTRNAFVAAKWRDDVPDDVLAQAAWQRLVTGLDHVHVACLIGGQRLIDHTYRADEQLEAYLFGAAQRVWQQVQDDEPPEVEWDRIMAELLEKLAPNRSGAREMTPKEYTKLMGAWVAKCEHAAIAGRAKAHAEAVIKNAMGSGEDAVEILTRDGDPVFTWKAVDRDAYAVAPTTYRALRGPKL